MFVDYNERNLIIEEAEDGIRRRTLDVLMKSGGNALTDNNFSLFKICNVPAFWFL